MKITEQLKKEVYELYRVDNDCTLKVDEFDVKGNKVVFVAAFKNNEFVDSLVYNPLTGKTSCLNKISYDLNINKLKNL